MPTALTTSRHPSISYHADGAPELTTAPVLPRLSRGRLRLLWFCVIGVLLRLTVLLRQRTGAEYASIDSEAVLQIGLVGMAGLVLLGSRPQIWLRRLSRTAAFWWFAFCGVGALSALWSASPLFSLYRAGEVAVLSMATFMIVLSARDWRQAESRVMWLAWIAIIAIAISTSRLYGWTLLGLRNNTFGAMSAILACYSFGVMLNGHGKRRKRFTRHFLAGAIMTVSSLSLASWWAMLAGILAVSLFSKRRGILVLIFFAACVVAMVGGEGFVQTAILRDREAAEVESLHGRRFLWEHYLEAFKQRPITGYGFAVGARETGPVYTTNTHNSLISVLIGIGIIGLIPVTIGCLRLLRDLRRMQRRHLPMILGITGAFLAAAVNSMANALLGEVWTPATFVFCCFFALFLYLYLAWRAPRQQTGGEPAPAPAPAPTRRPQPHQTETQPSLLS